MYTEEQARELVITAGMMLVDKGLVARTWGNVSAKCGEHEMIITPSGIAYESLKPEDLVKVNIDTLEYDGDIRPSSEKGIHAAVYKMREGVNFVIHTHQKYASIVGAEERNLSFAPCAAYGLPGTDRLKDNVIASLERNRWSDKFLLAKHGALLLGTSMDDAFMLAEELEKECQEEFEKRVPNIDEIPMKRIDASKYTSSSAPYAILVQDKMIAECTLAGVTVQPYLDDFAQMVGPDMKVVKNNKIDIMMGLVGRQAVLIKGVGALCVGKSQDDCEAAASIVSKNCGATCYVRKAHPLQSVDAIMQRIIYLTKYSKKKDIKS